MCFEESKIGQKIDLIDFKKMIVADLENVVQVRIGRIPADQMRAVQAQEEANRNSFWFLV